MAQTTTSRRAAGRRRWTAPPQLVSTVVQADEPLSFADLQEIQRPGQVDDLAHARRARARRPAGARRRRRVRRRQPVLAVRRPARPVGGAGPPGPPGAWSGSASDTQETVHLSVIRGDKVVQVAQVDSRYLLGTRDWTEVDVPAHTSALGKVFLAWDVPATPDAPLERLTAATIADREAALRARLRRDPRARLRDHHRRARGRPDRRRRARPRTARRRRRGARHLRPDQPGCRHRLDELGRNLISRRALESLRRTQLTRHTHKEGVA